MIVIRFFYTVDRESKMASYSLDATRRRDVANAFFWFSFHFFRRQNEGTLVLEQKKKKKNRFELDIPFLSKRRENMIQNERKQNGVLQFGRDPSPRRCQRVFLVFLPFLSTPK